MVLTAGDLNLNLHEQQADLAGSPLSLTNRTFQLLFELMQHPQQLLSKQHLIDTVWQGRLVSDSVLTTSIKALRKALDDPARQPTYIETVHGKGYRFLLPVETTITTDVKAPLSPPPQRKHITIGLISLLLITSILGYFIAQQLNQDITHNVDDKPTLSKAFAPDDNTIAVLPFLDLSPEGNHEHFSDGISEELLNVLAKIDALSVISRTSSFAFKRNNYAGISDIAQKLNVRYLLEGSVRKAGDNIRITAQLIDTLSEHHLWSGNYDRTLTTKNIFAIQDDISNAILSELLRQLNLEPTAVKLSTDIRTDNIDAYDLYLQANAKFIARGPENVKQSLLLYQRAVHIDPEFARAWAGIAAVSAVSPGWGFTDQDYYNIAIQAANKAIAINSDLSLPYAVIGLIEGSRIKPDYEKSLSMLSLAIEKNPKNTSALLWRGTILRTLGYFDQSLADIQTCQQLDPDYLNCRSHAALTYFEKGEIDTGVELWKANAALGWGGSWDALLEHFLQTGNDSAFLAAMRTFTKGRTHAKEWMIQPIYQAWSNPEDDHTAEYHELMARLLKTGFKPTDDPVLMWRLWLAFKVYDQMEPLGLSLFRWGPNLGNYPNSPDRIRLINQFGLPDYWRKHGFPAHCRPINNNDFECG